MTDNNQNSEINLNLKIPPERNEEGGTFGDIVLTLYNAKKGFFLYCAIGITLGLLAAAAYYVVQNRNTTPAIISGETSISLTLNYPGAHYALFPDGEAFSKTSFYEPELWINALNATGHDSISPADAMSAVVISQLGENELSQNGSSPEGDESAASWSMQSRLLINPTIELIIPPESAFLESSDQREAFLSAFCEEYKKSLNDKYFHDGNIGILYSQHLSEWKSLSKEIQWHTFRFDSNFYNLEDRYTALADLLKSLYREDPLYETNDGKSFNDLAEELITICDHEVRYWISRVSGNVYIRNIDIFIDESPYQLESMSLRREYSLEIVATYSDILSSFQQKDTTDGTIVSEAVDLLTTAQSNADVAADLQKQMKEIELYLEMLETNNTRIRANSRDAETAFAGLISELERNQDSLSGVLYNYYMQVNNQIAENSVISGTPVTASIKTTPESISTTRLIVVFVGLSFLGIVIGFCAAFIKKYLPEKV